MNEVGCFRFFTAEGFPFIETIGEDQTAFVTIAAAKGRLLCNRFAACIDQAATDGRVFCPHGNQPPYEKTSLEFIVIGNGKDGLGWRDVETRCELCREGIVVK